MIRWLSISIGAIGFLGLIFWAGPFLSVQYDLLSVRLVQPVMAPPASAPKTPLDAVNYFQCNRCHSSSGVLSASSMGLNCVTCHQAVLNGQFNLWYSPSTIRKWKGNLASLVAAPDLGSLSSRVKRSWLVDYLQAPYTIRPLYGASMPKLKIGSEQAELIADYFGVTEPDLNETASGSKQRGGELFEMYRCRECHLRGDSPVSMLRYGAKIFAQTPMSKRKAPDLRFVGKRMSISQLRNWLRNPHEILPDAGMPNLSIPEKDIEDLSAFLIDDSDLAPQEYPAPRVPKLLERTVGYYEVAQKLSSHLCFHCHSDMKRPGDRGPGNSGGLGYFGVGLDMATFEGVSRGVRGPDGDHGLPDELEDGTPRLVASLQARYQEIGGKYDPSILGMPLGFPPISEDEIDLVYTWIKQGAKKFNSKIGRRPVISNQAARTSPREILEFLKLAPVWDVQKSPEMDYLLNEKSCRPAGEFRAPGR